MRHLLLFPFRLAALLLFANTAMVHLPGLLEPLFRSTAGRSEVLSLLLCVFLVAIFTATWIWSARRR